MKNEFGCWTSLFSLHFRLSSPASGWSKSFAKGILGSSPSLAYYLKRATGIRRKTCQLRKYETLKTKQRRNQAWRLLRQEKRRGKKAISDFSRAVINKPD